MQDFENYNYTIKISDVEKAIRAAFDFGVEPLIIINGEYYDIDPEKEEEKA